MTDIRAALEALDLHCENFTGNDHRPAYDQCLRFGRTPDAHYGAERTCWPCTIRAALAAASPEPERTTIWYVPDCGYTHLSDDGTIYAVCPDGEPHAPAAPTVEALTVGIMTAEEYQEAFGEPAAPTVEALPSGGAYGLRHRVWSVDTTDRITGTDLRAYRASLRVTAVAVARRAGWSPQRVSQIEATTRPTRQAVDRYLAALREAEALR